MCIYLGDKPELSYKTKEHVIPAALGCRTTLELGVVSDQANQCFSPIELRFLSKSPLQVSRVILGPGERGSLSPKKAKKSKLSVVKTENGFRLGYLKGSDVYVVNQIVIYTDDEGERIKYVHGDVGLSENDCYSDMNSLMTQLKGWDGNYHFIPIDDEITILTVYENKYYVAAKDDLNQERINTLKALFNNNYGTRNPVFDSGRASIDIRFEQNNIDVFKVVAKTAMNTLAYLYGKEQVCNANELNGLRKAIFSSDDKICKYVQEIPNGRRVKSNLHLLRNEHACLIDKFCDSLISLVFFYDSFYWVKMSDNTDFRIDIINGLVCDWESSKDYKYYDYIVDIGEQMNGLYGDN